MWEIQRFDSFLGWVTYATCPSKRQACARMARMTLDMQVRISRVSRV